MGDYLSSDDAPDGTAGQRGCLWPGVLMLVLAGIAVVILYLVIPHLAWGEWLHHLTGTTRSSMGGPPVPPPGAALH